MSYSKWIAIEISSVNMTINVRNATLRFGKFHRYDNKDIEISAAEINRTTIRHGQSAWIFSCGRKDSPSGTQGRIDLYDGETKIGIFDWNSPWGAGRNSINWWPAASTDTYITNVQANFSRNYEMFVNPGTIGVVGIVIMKIIDYNKQ